MSVKFEYTGKLSGGGYFDKDSTKKVTFELDDNDLNVNEMLEEFMNFMKAIGYHFDLGDHFEIVNDFKNTNTDGFKLYDTGTSDPAFGAVPPNPASDV